MICTRVHALFPFKQRLLQRYHIRLGALHIPIQQDRSVEMDPVRPQHENATLDAPLRIVNTLEHPTHAFIVPVLPRDAIKHSRDLLPSRDLGGIDTSCPLLNAIVTSNVSFFIFDLGRKSVSLARL